MKVGFVQKPNPFKDAASNSRSKPAKDSVLMPNPKDWSTLQSLPTQRLEILSHEKYNSQGSMHISFFGQTSKGTISMF